MSALGELFSNIAAAIREKNGETGTMKPTKFPDKIRALVASGANNTGLKFKEGEFIPAGAGSGNTITHGMGVVPDVIVIFPGEAVTTDSEGGLLACIGFSAAVIEYRGGKDVEGTAGGVYLPNGSSMRFAGTSMAVTENTTSQQQCGMPRGATSELFYVGGGTTYYYNPGIKYRWLAIGNLLSA